jgi:predicted O-methyltransferase YrrM
MLLSEYSQHQWAKDAKEVLEKMKVVQELLEPVNHSHRVSSIDRNWKLKTKKFPYSCTDEEGLMLYFTIVENDFKSGFEIATGFGYSTAFLGLAFQKTGGKCISLDCYIEEFKEDYLYNESELISASEKIRSEIDIGKLPVGLDTAKSSAKRLGVENVIDFKVGLSPNDVPKVIGERKIDFAFIDGGHFGEQPTKDFLAVFPYLSDKCAVLFHDNNGNPYVQKAVIEAEKLLGSQAITMHTRHSLTIVGRKLHSEFIEKLKSFPLRRDSPAAKLNIILSFISGRTLRLIRSLKNRQPLSI